MINDNTIELHLEKMSKMGSKLAASYLSLIKNATPAARKSYLEIAKNMLLCAESLQNNAIQIMRDKNE